jgi:hypothetical protein
VVGYKLEGPITEVIQGNICLIYWN